MEEVEVGATGQARWPVTRERCVERGGLWVFSTPSLLLLMEQAAVDALKPFLRADQHSLGTRAELAHLAPTLEGMTVTAQARVEAVNGRRVRFAVEVHDDLEKVAEAVHERFVIDLDRYRARLLDKAARWRTGVG